MKKTDIAMIILIASISALVAYFVAKAVLGEPSKETVKVKTIDTISSDVQPGPDPKIFNAQAINPTVEVTIGDTQSSGQ